MPGKVKDDVFLTRRAAAGSPEMSKLLQWLRRKVENSLHTIKDMI